MSRKTRLKRSIDMTMRPVAHEPQSRTRKSKKRVSQKTISDRWAFYYRLVDIWYDRGYKFEKIQNLERKHIEAIFSHWDDKGLKVHTIQNYLTMLRQLIRQVGKVHLIERVDGYGKRKSQEEREQNVEILSRDDSDPEKQRLVQGRSWDAHNVDIHAAIERVLEKDPIIALQMTLIRNFGLRVSEVHRLRPGADWDGEQLHVHRGTKGGLERWVEVAEPEQKELLAHAREVAKQLGDYGSMMPEDYTEVRWRNYYYSTLRRCGVTRKGLGVTSHGLRHQYAQESYLKLTGREAPVRRGSQRASLEKEFKSLDMAARHKIAEQLGHGRYDITRFYLDSKAAIGGLPRTTIRQPRRVQS